MPATYEIHEVAELTGLQAARLRVWERRYAAVRPVRQPNGYRAYSAEQVELLRAYARLIAAGERIGDLVSEPVESVIARAEGRDPAASPHAALLDAVKAFDRDRLETLVAQQLALRSLADFAELVTIPLARDIGELWALGRLPAAAEHLATEVVVHALKGGLRGGGGPLLVSACLPGERHEWGILAALARVRERGWRVMHLGTDLPAGELAEAAWSLRPAVVAVSSADPLTVQSQLGHLGALPVKLPPGCRAAAGGAGMAPHERLLRTYGYRIGMDGLRELTEDSPKEG